MDGSTVAIALRKDVYPACRLSDGARFKARWFSKIPPERIGLHGEFDYHGLSKRVYSHLSSNVLGALGQLKVRQRGRVIIFSGRVASPSVLRQVVKLALSVDGVDEVETYGVKLPEAC